MGKVIVLEVSKYPKRRLYSWWMTWLAMREVRRGK